jgi:hypothetical protein
MSPVYLPHSLVGYGVRSDMSAVYLAHSLVVYRVEKSHVSGFLSSFSCSV